MILFQSKNRILRHLRTAGAFVFAATFLIACGDSGGGSGEEEISCPDPIEITDTHVEEPTTLDNHILPMGCVDYEFNSSNYIIDSDLSLEPGVVIAFENGVMSVKAAGTLSAAGTPDLPIVLTAKNPTAGTWSGLKVTGGEAVLEHATVEYGGLEDQTNSNYDAPATLTVRDDATVTITDSTIGSGSGYGIFMDNSSSASSFSGNTITGNAIGPVYADAPSVHYFGADNTYTPNGQDTFYVDVSHGQVEGDRTWESIGLPFYLDGRELIIPEGATLSLAPGTILELKAEMVLAVRGGVLNSMGTEDARITIRNSPDQGNFGSILVDDGTANMAYTTITNGGGVATGTEDILANMVITSFTKNDDQVGRAVFQGGMQNSGAEYGLAFHKYAGSANTTKASGCAGMGPLYWPEPDDKAGQCD